MIRPWLRKATSPELLDVILEHWIAAIPQVTSALNLELYRRRLAYDQLILEALRRVDRRVLIYNLANAFIEFASYGSQLANLLLLVMVVFKLAPPSPAMQFALPSLVLVILAVEILWLKYGMEKVLGR